MNRIFLIISLIFSGVLNAGLPRVLLSDKTGEILDGGPFDTSILKGKTFLLVHIAPSAEKLNDKAQQALEEAKLKGPKYGSVVIINAKSTWIPNGILRAALKFNKDKHPDTIFVLDYTKTFVDQWNFKDDSSSFMVINSNGLPIFRKDGLLSDEDITRLIDTIKANI